MKRWGIVILALLGLLTGVLVGWWLVEDMTFQRFGYKVKLGFDKACYYQGKKYDILKKVYSPDGCGYGICHPPDMIIEWVAVRSPECDPIHNLRKTQIEKEQMEKE